ncbi:hypothetical protein M2277_005042 [Paenibacillus sp. LBL]|uniref:hypothetical protein n=1 Tax=Paenibacillus sp. LBL TaxID=2940563 RepID=UPI002473F93F|nr:hypothetical protein [Paenibacillus sp. LBL]MDH6674350.1 hypothetical protein [Paenibacillus sp. LBL]
MGWEKVTDFQYVNNLGDQIFNVINILDAENSYLVQFHTVNLKAFDSKLILALLTQYGYNYNMGELVDLKGVRVHKSMTDNILAEILSETQAETIHTVKDFSSYGDVLFYLQTNYGISYCRDNNSLLH